MNKFTKSGLAAVALAFTAAAPALAHETVPAPNKERMESIRACFNKVDEIINAHDTRTETLEQFYLFNNKNREAIQTAVASGKFEDEVKRAGQLGEMIGMSAIAIVDSRHRLCVDHADGNGVLPKQQEEIIAGHVKTLVEQDTQLMDIAKKLKTEGDKMLANGATPPDPRNPKAYLFRLTP